jgi:hypothetical protein
MRYATRREKDEQSEFDEVCSRSPWGLGLAIWRFGALARQIGRWKPAMETIPSTGLETRLNACHSLRTC